MIDSEAVHYLLSELEQECFGSLKQLNRFDEILLNGIWYLDLDNGQYEYLTDQFWHSLDCNPSKMEYTPSSWQKLVKADDLIELNRSFGEHLQNPTRPFNQIVTFELEDGSVRKILCRGQYLQVNGKNRVVGFHIDLTDSDYIQKGILNSAGAKNGVFSLINNRVLLVDRELNVLEDPLLVKDMDDVDTPNECLIQILGQDGYNYLPQDFKSILQGSEIEGTTQFTSHPEGGAVNWHLRIRQLDENTFLLMMANITENEQIQLQLEKKTSILEVGLQIAAEFVSATADNDPDQIVDSALQKIGEHFQADRAYIFNYDFNVNTTSNTHEWCFDGIEPQIEYLQDIPTPDIEDLWLSSHRKGDYVYIEDVSLYENETIRELLLEQEIQSLVTIPILIADKLIGFVGLDWVNRKAPIFSGEVETLKFLASFLGIFISKMDVRKFLKFERRFSEEVVNRADIPLFIQNKSGQIIDANESFCRLIQVEKSELLKLSPPYFFWSYEQSEWIAKFEKEHRIEFNTHFTKPDGNRIHVDINAEYIEFEGHVRILNTCTDLTSEDTLRENVAELENFLSLSQVAGKVGNFRMDAEHNIHVSKMFCEIFGIENAQITKASQLRRYIDLDWSYLISVLEHSVGKRKSFKDRIPFKKSGQSKWVEIDAFIQYDRLGDPIEMFGTIRDVTEEHIHLKNIEIQNERLKDIAWMQSHSLRAPLAKILSIANEIEEGDTENLNWLLKSLKETTEETDEILRRLIAKSESFGIGQDAFPEPSKNSRKEILFVDDDKLTLALQSNILSKRLNDTPILTFEHALDALKHLESAANDDCDSLVLLDINMPGMSGWDFLEELNLHPHISNKVKVVMVSSSVESNDKKQAYTYPQVIGFVEKPFSKSTIDVLSNKRGLSHFFSMDDKVR